MKKPSSATVGEGFFISEKSVKAYLMTISP